MTRNVHWLKRISHITNICLSGLPDERFAGRQVYLPHGMAWHDRQAPTSTLLSACFSRSALVATAILLIHTLAFSQVHVNRIEPPSWWTGMKHPSVQLMVHGEKISELAPTLRYQGVKISKVHNTDNPNYLFIDLVIHPKAKPGKVQLDFIQGRTVVTTHTWELHARESGSAQRAGFNSSDVIYLITPDRYANGNPANDDIAGMKEGLNRAHKNGRHGGDIEGVRQHLGYIRDMGFTAVWMMPVLENDMQRSSYHGYSTTDYYSVDPRFGTNEEFRRLVQESKAMGLKHIMDLIPNHCGSEHWWMQDMPANDWLNTWDDFTQSNHRKTAVSDPYVAHRDVKQFTDGWFVRTMPDLNQRNPFMATYLTQNAIWWIEYLGLAGLRIDTYPYSDADFLSQYCRRILDEYPNLNIVGEQWHTIPAIVAYWQRGVSNTNGYVSQLPSVMDFPLHHAMISGLTAAGGWEDHWLKVYETLAQDFLYADPLNIMVFPDNHDMSRIFTQVNEDFDLYRLALTFLLTTRGIPQIFYGTEILMKNPGTDDHTIIRSDFPGGWEGDQKNGFTGAGLSQQEKAAQDFVRKLLLWRKSAPVVHSGKLMHFSPKDNVYVCFRYNDSAKVMVILNKNREPYTLHLDSYAEMLAGISSGRDVLSGTEYSLQESINLSGAGPLILELNP